VLSLMLLSVLPSGCSQGGVVEGEVHYKFVTGMQDRRYFIIVRNEPTDGQPSIVFDPAAEEEIRRCFPSEGNLVVDNYTEAQIEVFYTRIEYIVSLHLASGDEVKYSYYQACKANREDFNKLVVGSRVIVETQPSDIGPVITRIVE